MTSIIKKYETLKKIIKNILYPVIGEVLMLHNVTQYKENIPDEKLRYSITPDYLESLIKEYRSKGFRFVTLDEVEQIITRQSKAQRESGLLYLR